MQDALNDSGRAAQHAERAEELQRAVEAAAEQSAADAEAAQRANLAAESQLAQALQSNAEVCRTQYVSCTEDTCDIKPCPGLDCHDEHFERGFNFKCVASESDT
jgi:hypothetical protein